MGVFKISGIDECGTIILSCPKCGEYKSTILVVGFSNRIIWVDATPKIYLKDVRTILCYRAEETRIKGFKEDIKDMYCLSCGRYDKIKYEAIFNRNVYLIRKTPLLRGQFEDFEYHTEVKC